MEDATQPIENAEIIRCRCGCLFAACVDGLQSPKWNARKEKHVAAGCRVSMMPMKEVKLGSCSCDKLKPAQLKLFEDA